MSRKAVTETANETVTEAEQQSQAATETETQAGATQTSGVNDGQQPAATKVFTQDELNNIVTQRVQQERRKYQDYEDLRQRVEQYESGQQRVAELEQQNQQLATTAKQTAIEAAIAKAAGAIGLDPDAAYRLADIDSLTLDDAGKPTNAADVVKAVAERFPGLLKRPMPTAAPVNQQASGHDMTPEQKERELRQRVFGGGAAGFWNSGGVRWEE